MVAGQGEIQIFTRSQHSGDVAEPSRPPVTLADVNATAGKAPADVHKGMILALVGAAQFMVILDVSIVNVALPSIRDDLGFSLGGLQWVVNAYTITFGGLLLLGGRASDLLGRRRMFITGIVVFALASLAGAVAPSAGFLVVARAIQGVGGAIVSPSTLAVLMTTFREGPERHRAFGVWGAMTAGGGSAERSWEASSRTSSTGAGSSSSTSRSGPRSPGRRDGASRRPAARARRQRSARAAGELRPPRGADRHRRADGGGLRIVRTTTEGWTSPQTIISLAAAVLLLAAFVVIEARFASQPLVPLRIFESRLLTGANVLVLLLGAAMFAMWYFVSPLPAAGARLLADQGGPGVSPDDDLHRGRLDARRLDRPRFGIRTTLVRDSCSPGRDSRSSADPCERRLRQRRPRPVDHGVARAWGSAWCR